jgi:hypothetical protein
MQSSTERDARHCSETHWGSAQMLVKSENLHIFSDIFNDTFNFALLANGHNQKIMIIVLIHKSSRDQELVYLVKIQGVL